MKKFIAGIGLALGSLGFVGCSHQPKQAVPPAATQSSGYENYYIKLAGPDAVERRPSGVTILKLAINGVPARMLVNERSDSSAITPQFRERLKLNLLNVAEASMANDNNKKVWLDIVALEHIQIARYTFSLSPVVVIDVNQGQPAYGPVDGILGRDFLESKQYGASQN